MVSNKVVVQYKDGNIVKGSTGDFLPTLPYTHFSPLKQGLTLSFLFCVCSPFFSLKNYGKESKKMPMQKNDF